MFFIVIQVAFRSVARHFDISHTVVSRIVKNRQNVEAQLNLHPGSGNRKVCAGLKFPEIDGVMYEWLQLVRSKKIPVTGALLREKAAQVADALGIASFSASVGWQQKFTKRHQISSKELRGESADANLDRVREWKSTELQAELEGFDERDIFNLDETALFYRALPSRSYVFAGDDARGGKMAKERIT